MSTPKIKNLETLRLDLLEVYERLRLDPKEMLRARELSNVAGKVIGTAKLELEYAALRGEKPEIAFISGK
jgi:hypothetical protein